MPQLHSQGLNFYAQFYEVRRRLAEVSAAYWTDLEIFNWLNQAQQDIAIKARCLKKKVTVTTINGTQEYDLKDNSFSDIIDISEDGVYFYQNGSSYIQLDYTTKAKLNKDYPGWRGTASGTPTKYYYDKSSKTIGLYQKPNSSNAGAYLFIEGIYKPKILNAGTASAVTATTISLQAGSTTYPYPNPTDDYYNGLYIEIYSGTGAGQLREITDYDGATVKCTVSTWTTNPNTSSIYGIMPEISEEAHHLMVLYTLGRAWSKGGIRTQLGNNFMQQYYQELQIYISEFMQTDDEVLIKDSYK